MIATNTQVKQIENTLDFLDRFGVEINLKEILITEFEQGLPSDITNSF